MVQTLNGCKKGKTCPDPAVLDKIDESVKVWTYNGDQAEIGGQGAPATPTEADLYKNPVGKASVNRVTSGFSQQEKLDDYADVLSNPRCWAEMQNGSSDGPCLIAYWNARHQFIIPLVEINFYRPYASCVLG